MARAASSPPRFLIGANLPWVHYGIDFGANRWRPDGGVAQPDGRAEVEAAFAQLAASGVHCVRWFLFCDGRAGIRFSPGGRPLGLDDFVFRDVDAALDAARRHGIAIMFALFDFLWCGTVSATHGVQMGGRAHAIADGGHRDALLNSVMRPLLERYGSEPEIFAWDIINEPEWITAVDADDLRAFLGESAALVHSSTRHPVTVGSAGMRWRDRYADLGLDFYQVHWYGQPDASTIARHADLAPGFRSAGAARRVSHTGLEAGAGCDCGHRARGGIFGRVLLVGAGER